jgi:hypothetical protein
MSDFCHGVCDTVCRESQGRDACIGHMLPVGARSARACRRWVCSVVPVAEAVTQGQSQGNATGHDVAMYEQANQRGLVLPECDHEATRQNE